MEFDPDVVLRVMVLLVVKPATVGVTPVPPMIRLPPVVVALPREMAAVLLFRDLKSVTVMAPAVMLIVPATVVPTPLMVRLPAPDFVKVLPASVPAITLP